MKNILLITSRDVIDEVGKATSVGAATLIYKRATAFYQNYKYTTFILPLNGAVKTKSTGHLGSEYINYKNMSSKKSIEKFIRSKHPKIIIFSGEKSYLYHSNVRKLIKKENLNSELILDLHGALEEGIEHSSGIASIFAYFRYIIKKSLYKSVAKESESLLVVSDELAKHSIKLLPDNRNDKNIYKIRCGVSEVLKNDDRFIWRKEIRNKLGIKDDTLVFVYSGFRAKWQNIDEIIRIFKKINQLHDNVYFVLLTNTDEDFERLVDDAFPEENYFCAQVPQTEVHKYLVACDVGMLIRYENNTNKVAFPNKFSDYINAGLSLCISPSLREPVRILDKYEVPFIKLMPDENYIKNMYSQFEKRKKKLEKYYNICNIICETELLYSAQLKHIICE